jgi:hypothetical protein
MRMRVRRGASSPLAALIALALSAAAARGEEVPRITAANVAAYQKLLPSRCTRAWPTASTCCRWCWSTGTLPRQLHDRFWQASQANRGKFGIDAATGGLTAVATGAIPTRFFGLPFPEIDPKDPFAGVKIVHNYRARRMQMDGDFHIFDLSDVEQSGEVRRTVRILLSQAYYVGTTAEPPATLPDNTESRQLAAALAPKDLEGVGVLTWRINDWTTWDQVWAYLPTIRRVRRVRSSTRGDRIPGFEVQGDDADCYDNKASYFAWKLIRADEVIGPLGSDTPYARTLTDEPPSRRVMTLPYNAAVYETPGAKGAGWFPLGNVYAKRPVWIVEGTPRDPYYEAARIVLYVDRDLYNGYYKLSYNKAGELYRTNFCGTAWGRSADGGFGAPTALLMLGVNEKENRGTPAGRFTKQTYDRAFADGWFTTGHLDELSSAISGTPSPAP